MKKRIFRLLALSLAAAVCLPLIVSCGAGGSASTGTEDTAASSESETKAPEAEKPSYPSLEGKTPLKEGGTYVVRDLSYGPRVDMKSKTSRASSQIFDLYLPAKPGEIPADAPVFLYIHGGAWSDVNYVKDTEGNWLPAELAAQYGMVACSMNYVLTGSQESGDSVEDMINDIDLMVSHLKDLLAELGVETKTIGVGGTSAGGHLSALYAYKCGENAPLKVAYEVDVVGPVDMTSFEDMIDSFIKQAGSFDALMQSSMGAFSEIFGGLAGMKDLTEATFPDLWKKMKEISATEYVKKTSCPTILLYGVKPYSEGDSLPPDVKGDGMVPFVNYETLEAKLKENGVPYVGKVIEGYGHGDFPWKEPARSWVKEQINDFAAKYAK